MSKILVIEDEESVRANLTEMLEEEGYQVLQAADGISGLSLARAQAPDIVLCDIMMPELDGHGVLKGLRADPATATLPFIFLTARADRTDVREGMGLGADDFLTKPFTRKELLGALETRLRRESVLTGKIQARCDDLRWSITLALPHELRTPLNGILGCLQILLQDHDSLPEEVKELLGCLQASATRLNDLIQHFLLYLELEIAVRDRSQAKALLVPRRFRIAPSVRTVAFSRAEAAAREEDLTVEMDEAEVEAGPEYLDRAVGELVGNAFKFSPPGTPVRIGGRRESGAYVLTVADRGFGMTAKQIAEAGALLQFDRKRREQQGSGLGLAIARRIVELSGGEVRISSEPGRGTTVEVRIPLAP